ncbi:3-deoxy-7-phosphoheptulonate synthase [bacterium]|nr:3-deoxy-7-phosphoheptulonate synthase [bacterium]MBU1983996.1 3-deoxy-7-phosphoheptulonate synthase [bacterium]
MLIIMKSDATDEQIQSVVRSLEESGCSARVVSGSARTAIAVSGDERPLDPARVELLPGVLQALRVAEPFRLVTRENHAEDSVVHVGDVAVGGRELTVIAGPCAVESKQQLFETALRVKSCGVRLLRGGAYKPRTSPYSFQGLGEEGMRLLAEVGEAVGLPVVSEVVDEHSTELAKEFVDVIQIGARNMQNYVLLKRAARCGKPVLLKRGVAATLEEFLGAAEYIMAEGNPDVILCERGIRTFSDYTRNTLDLSIVPVIKAVSHLPIITDPSHATGRRDIVLPLARASIAAGADGVMVEIHPDPARALSDGNQSLYPLQLDDLTKQLAELAPSVGRTFSRSS